MKERIRKYFWVEKENLFADGIRNGRPGGTFSAVTNYWILYARIATPEQERKILKRLYVSDTRENMKLWDRGESPYSKFFISEALLARGLWKKTFTQWRGFYTDMLGHPEAMSVFEMWDRSWSLKKPVPRNSLVHAFGIGPMAHLISYVAGIKPLKPGYDGIRWQPMPGDLKWFTANVPLPGHDYRISIVMKTLPSGKRRLVLSKPKSLVVQTNARFLNDMDEMVVKDTV
jgi:hypothetical protein